MDEIISDYSPKLHDIHRYADNYMERGKFKKVVGNYEARMTIPLVFALKKVPVVLKGPAGSGKTTIIKSSATMIWGESILDGKIREVLYIAGASDKGHLSETQASRIANVCTHCVVPELQNAISNERLEAIIKLWAEGETYQYMRADNGGRISREINLKPLPILTSIATENKYTESLGEEMERRFFPFYTIANKELNKKIHESKAISRARCDEELITMSQDEKADLRGHFQDVMQKKHKVKNPTSVYMETAIPNNYVVSNSMIDYWFDLVEAITLFHYTDRPTYSHTGGSRYIVSTPDDNWYAWKLGGKAIVLASMNIPDMGREIIEILPLRDSITPNAGIEINDIVDELQRLGIERTKRQIQQILKALESVNYAKRDTHDKEFYYRTKDYHFETSINWVEAIAATKKAIKEGQPEIAKDYIKNYCDDPVVYDPFTDEKIKLLDIPFVKETVMDEVTKTKINIESFL